ncbi:phosphoribosylanthranilate isomerase [Priestia taiwanensis]|uniref:N-(5'-phosphoribosyl)anthranilate isomerase n=1 Tax=Priestia taiwanensis TaxID=1347902 RepID=A0A917AUU8_9BACI|nr:phosphoribosylanthranilate isomerase [Priestia taiwanensis]MBM7363356.1 phosphoribosylanthranilate isomerase [Priestia taiwanensis]GGE77829.1 N-(5'-phosphoribosyl)anthranilate isomerase [Priestia taiwanensis]
MKVKVCGISDIPTAQAVYEYGADMIGFVFAKSKRRVTPEQAKEIIESLPATIEKVGVFVNEERDVVQEIVGTCGLTMVQFHGEETEAYCQSFRVPVIKAFRANTEEDVQQAFKYNVAYHLFDSSIEQYYGGNGTSFDWDVLKGNMLHNQIILAGGLHVDNVQRAIQEVHPAVVDVSSGVETNGKKDSEKIKQFIVKAKGEIR